MYFGDFYVECVVVGVGVVYGLCGCVGECIGGECGGGVCYVNVF